MSTCLFCEHELNASTKPEHVLLNALGGRRKSTRLICSDCNNEFGSTIDAALASQVPAIRNTLQLPSGTGKPPPSLKKVQAGADIVDFRNDGTPELTGAPFRFVPDGDGLRIEIDARSPEHLNSLIPNIASKLGATEAHVRELLLAGSANHISRRPGTIHQRLSFGGEEALRSMTKA